MKPINKWLVLTLLLPCLLSAMERPDVTQTKAWSGFSMLDFDYQEFPDNDAMANSEEGLVPGMTAGVSVSQGRWFAATEISAWSGDVDYQGPVDTRTNEKIIDWNAVAGRGLYRKGKGDIGLFAGFGYRNWKRDIHSTATASGLFETYDWWYGMLGIRGTYHFNPATRLRVDASLTRTVNPQIDVDFESNYDDVKLALGEASGSRIRLTVDQRLNDAMRIWLSPWYEYWALGRSSTQDLSSNGLVTATVYEPRSESKNFGINIGVSWVFGNR